MKTSTCTRMKIRNSVNLICDHLIFDLQKRVQIQASICSGSVYIYFDDKKIKISDHDYFKNKRHFFIDIGLFTSPEYCLKYFIDNCLRDVNNKASSDEQKILIN